MSSLQAFYAGAFDQSEKTIGLTVSVQEAGGTGNLPKAMVASGVWTSWFQSATILPLGQYMISANLRVDGLAFNGINMEIGFVNSDTATQPLAGTQGGASASPATITFTAPFVSVIGFQSPKWFYYNDSSEANASISSLGWTAVKLD
jgi:hypothetical protein